MKKSVKYYISIFMLVVCLLMTSVTVFASETNTVSSPISIMATSPPTTYAPESWYDTDKSWSCKSYTWSSYIFEPSIAYINSDEPFKVTIYYPEDGSTSVIYAEYFDGKYRADFDTTMAYDYYFKITNTSSSSRISGTYNIHN